MARKIFNMNGIGQARRIGGVLLFLLLPGPWLLFAQTNTRVDLSEWEVYALMESAEQRGLIDPVMMQQPYPRSFVRERLEEIAMRRGALSERERRIIENRMPYFSGESGAAAFNTVAETDNVVTPTDITRPHSINALGFEVEGDALPWLSVQGIFSMMLDRTNRDAFLPYTYSKSWDHHHYAVEDRIIGRSDEMLSISNRAYGELVASSPGGTDYIRLGRYRRGWGPGDGSLLLSETARPFDGIETGFRLGSRAYVSTVVGSLGRTADAEPETEQKMISAHRLTVALLPRLSISFWDAAIWGKRLELAYMLPLSVYLVGQKGTAGDVDNSMVGFDMAIDLSPMGSLYGSIFIDEIDYTRMDELFSAARNMFAFSAGMKLPLRFLPFGSLNLQYTKLEPFVYTHYLQPYDFYESLININYTHDGENLGSPLPPNSDELRLRLSFLPTHRLGVELLVRSIRHGDNPGTDEYLIMGDVDVPLPYGPGVDFDLDEYPEKDFLHDGVYEKILSISARLSFRFFRPETKIYIGYGFAYMRNRENIEGNDGHLHSFSLGGSYTLPLVR